MGLHLGGLIIGRIFASEIWGAYFGRAFFLGGGGGRLIIGILQYVWMLLFDMGRYKLVNFYSLSFEGLFNRFNSKLVLNNYILLVSKSAAGKWGWGAGVQFLVTKITT